MKNNKKLLVTTSLLLFATALVPFTSFAETKTKGNDHEGVEIKLEHRSNVKVSSHSNSILNRIKNALGTSVYAASTSLIPNISGIKAPTMLNTGQVGTWTVKASDPQNGSLMYAVDWGDTVNTNMMKTLAPTEFTQTSTFTHAYANPGKYLIKFTVSNDAGMKATSTTTVYVLGSSVQNAPVISNLTVKSVESNKATVRWDTDVSSSSLVWYGTTSPVDTSVKPNISRIAGIKDHKINLKKLEPNTKYYLIVGSENKVGKTLSSETSFTTPAIVDNNTPVIKSIEGSTEIKLGETAEMTIKASDPKNGNLLYSVNWGDTMFKTALMVLPESPFVQSSTFTHVYSLPGTYTAVFTVENDAGLKASSSVSILVKEVSDTTPPVISSVEDIKVGSTTATITWKTDEPSDDTVFYSTSSPVSIATASFVANNSLKKDHSVTISGLTPNTKYYLFLENSDSDDNTTKSVEYSFVTNP